ncbi:DUF2145 domain-containing protein [Collimonas sp. NPDC087041]|uniref:DUF2145 domain-containing protein n=1 Tax=Collimonas sp. NPDC087041 TaxID=3363960 RepID=UPI003808EA45
MLRRFSCSIALGFALHGAAFAGQACSDTPPRPDSVRMAFNSASDLAAELDKEQPQVALLARVGQDLSKYGLRYSHIAFVLKDPASGNWRTMHLLNECGTAHSAIWKEGLANFFLDDLFSYDSLLIIPSAAGQQKILSKLQDPAQYLALFTPDYNMLAYPFATRYENSNQWVLELLTVMYADNLKIDSREKAQQWLKLMGYEPTTLKLGPMTRLGGRMFRANVAFDDHPNERRFADKIDIVTVVSMTQFMQKIDPAVKLIPIPEPKLTPLPN